jgi:hypothetical protein
MALTIELPSTIEGLRWGKTPKKLDISGLITSIRISHEIP